jgi:DeoR family glycerol-3-phosphate regulon repressor
VLDREEPAFDARLADNRAVKERIAAAALDLIGSSKTIALDVGTTTYLLAARLLVRNNLMVFTNSLRIASLLSTGGNEVYLPGGRVRRDEMSIHGPAAVAHFEKLWFDVAFIGVSGATRDGFFDYSAEDSELKRVYLRRSGRKIVLCDSQKFNRMSLVQVASLSEVDVLVTDCRPPPDIMEALTAAEVEVWVAPEVSPAPK